MKHVLIFLSTLILSSTAFSQTGIDTSKVCLSTNVARQVAQDLISGDSVKEELKITKNILYFTEQKSIYKDSIISGLETKNNLYKQQINISQEQFNLCQNRNIKLEKKLNRHKTKSKVAVVFGLVGLAAGASAFLMAGK